MLILASASAIRATMLEQAGVEFVARGTSFDEDAVKAAHHGGNEALAARLAEGKALAADARPDDWVIGADSCVTVEGRRFSKPRSRDEAAEHLALFSGRTLLLSSGVALARAGALDWSHVDTARLVVRSLSDAFIAAYLDGEWPAVGYCAGVFRMEGLGVTLFDAVEGSHFTILGMPLVPLLGALRERGLMAS